MPVIHQIEEVRVYCGPAALMAVTGLRLPAVRQVINRICGRRDNQGVRGLSVEDMERSLKALGVWNEHTAVAGRVTLAQWCDDIMERDELYIVHITGHYVTVLNGLLIDNHYRFGTDINDDCKWARKKVKNYYRIVVDNSVNSA